MAKVKMSKMSNLVWIVVIGLIFLLPSNLVLAATKSSCSIDAAKELINICKRSVQIEGPIVAPTAVCCHAVQAADIPCFCNYVTPVVEKMVSMKKVVYVAGKCGRPFPPKSKCGSYIVQMA